MECQESLQGRNRKSAEEQFCQFNKENFNLDDFLIASQRYLRDPERARIPVLDCDSAAKFDYDKRRISVFFYDDLLRLITMNMTKFRRDLNEILTYGYIGNSRGGKNGLVVIPTRDRELRDVVERFSAQKYKEFCDKLGIQDDKAEYSPVKVVCHRKSGERIVGVLNKRQKKGILYDVRQYKK
jgi:hypothetical protein